MTRGSFHEGSSCNLLIRKVNFNCIESNAVLSFRLRDSIISSDGVLCYKTKVTETGFLGIVEFLPCSGMEWTKTRMTVDAWGGVTETKVYMYGTAKRCGLFVSELKKNGDDKKLASAMTLAHYFVYSNGEIAVERSNKTIDIGFSVVVKVGVSDGKLDIRVDGPEQHPVSALLYMFDEVNRTGNWSPTMCLHCGNIRREHSRMLWQSDSEDNGVPRPSPGLERLLIVESSRGTVMVVPLDAKILLFFKGTCYNLIVNMCCQNHTLDRLILEEQNNI